MDPPRIGFKDSAVVCDLDHVSHLQCGGWLHVLHGDLQQSRAVDRPAGFRFYKEIPVADLKDLRFKGDAVRGIFVGTTAANLRIFHCQICGNVLIGRVLRFHAHPEPDSLIRVKFRGHSLGEINRRIAGLHGFLHRG